jgi:YD repeat-containing protein
MAQNTKSVPGIKNSEQTILNTSFDEDFGVLAVELLSHNPISDTLERVSSIQGNPSLALTYDGSDQLTTIEMTIGSTTYTKTLTWTDGLVTNISTWS